MLNALRTKSLRNNTLRLGVLSALSVQSQMSYADQVALEEIVVTATRRSESVLDVPYNISVLSGADLRNAGVLDFSDLMNAIPGVAGTDLGSRGDINNNLILRGINATDASASAVATNQAAALISTYLNDTPVFFNVRLRDVDRVEVLRGPQGTLYGSGAVGGTLKILFKKPSLEDTNLTLAGGYGNNNESSDDNYNGSAVFNIPLTSTTALRGFAGYDRQGGVVDNTRLFVRDPDGNIAFETPGDINSAPLTKVKKDTDDADVYYTRLSLLWAPSEDTQATLAYHYQDSKYGHSTQRNLNTSKESWEDEVTILEPLDREVNISSLELEHDFGFASFTSSTSYSENEAHWHRDSTDFYRTLSAYYYNYPRLSAPDDADTKLESFAQELRLVSQGDGDWDWVLGAYYNEQDSDYSNPNVIPGFAEWTEDPEARDAIYGLTAQEYLGYPTYADFIEFYLGGVRPSANDNLAFTVNQNTNFKDFAVFGEVSYHLTDRWQITAGGRQFWQDFSNHLRQTIPYCGPACSDDGVNPEGLTVASSTDSFDDAIFKANTSYEINDDTSTYLTWSEGFRRGGVNALPQAGPFYDPTVSSYYDPDTATNTELGIKGYMWERRLSYTLALYHIKWEDLQLDTFTAAGFQAVFNSGDATSQGVELELTAQLTDRLTASFGYSYTDAELDQDVNTESVAFDKGDTLPNVPENQATLSVSYLIPSVWQSLDINFNVQGSYRDAVYTSMNASTDNYIELDEYTLWNATVSLIGERWRAGLFAKNIGNEEAMGGAAVRNANRNPSGPLSSELGRRGFVGRPREIGINFEYRFGD